MLSRPKETLETITTTTTTTDELPSTYIHQELLAVVHKSPCTNIIHLVLIQGISGVLNNFVWNHPYHWGTTSFHVFWSNLYCPSQKSVSWANLSFPFPAGWEWVWEGNLWLLVAPIIHLCPWYTASSDTILGGFYYSTLPLAVFVIRSKVDKRNKPLLPP